MRYEAIELASILEANQDPEKLDAIRRAHETLAQAGVVIPEVAVAAEKKVGTEDLSIPPKPRSLSLGNALFRLRIASGETQEDVAIRAGLPRSTVADVEYFSDWGRTDRTRSAIVKALGVDPKYLK